ncbi:hypothetical protein ACWC2T_45565, partial [Streptomyces sp. NPDC001393]
MQSRIWPDAAWPDDSLRDPKAWLSIGAWRQFSGTARTAGAGSDLDRVLCGEAHQSLVAADGCGQAEKGQVVTGIA